jgi:hypothetical protein
MKYLKWIILALICWILAQNNFAGWKAMALPFFCGVGYLLVLYRALTAKRK